MATMKAITRKEAQAAELDWTCRECRRPITSNDKYRVLFKDRRIGVVVRLVPLRYHAGC